jgi:hypothetical protein
VVGQKITKNNHKSFTSGEGVLIKEKNSNIRRVTWKIYKKVCTLEMFTWGKNKKIRIKSIRVPVSRKGMGDITKRYEWVH